MSVKHPLLKERRDKLRALGLCICGPDPDAASYNSRASVTHGPVVTAGGKCQRCVDAHRGYASRKQKPHAPEFHSLSTGNPQP